MKKIIILLFIISGIAYAQDPFGKANQTPIGFYTNYTGTATTSSGTVTLNKLAGVITTDGLSGGNGSAYQVNNSYVTATSIIIITVESADFPTNLITSGITGVSDGSFTVRVNSETATFTQDVKIHFLIIN